LAIFPSDQTFPNSDDHFDRHFLFMAVKGRTNTNQKQPTKGTRNEQHD